MAKGDIITAKDIIESDVYDIGSKMVKSLEPVEASIKNVNSLLEKMSEQLKQTSKATTNSQFLADKQKETILTQQITNGLKEQTLAFQNAEKEKQQLIKTNLAQSLSNDKIVTSNNNIIISNNKVSESENKKAQLEETASKKSIKSNEDERISELKLQKDREDAFDKFVAEENKKAQLENRKPKTSEEIVNQRILAKSADTLAKQNSILAGSYANLSARAQIAGKELQDIKIKGKGAEQSQHQYNAELLIAQSRFDLYNKKLLDADKAVGAWSRSNVRSVDGLKNLKDGISSTISAFGLFTGVALASKLSFDVININKKLSDDLAQLQIYLKGTEKDADDVFNSLKKLETRTSLDELLGLAQIVAKKGVVKEEIAGIVKELDNLFLVLGDTVTDKGDFTASLVKIISLFNDQGQITSEKVRDLGSAFTYLTTSGVATGDFLIDYTERVGASRSLTGQTVEEVLGLGAAFEQLGQSVEVAGTGTGQIITKMLTNVESFAKKANIPVEKFKELLLTDSSEALIRFSEGLLKNSKNTIEFAEKLQSLGIKGARIRSIIAEIASNPELFRKKIIESKKAVEDYGKTAESAALKQKTFAGTLKEVTKEFEIIETSQGVQDFFSDISIALLKITQTILLIPFSVIVGGLSAWIATQALLKGELILSSIALAWNNEQTAIGTIRSVASRLGIIAESEAIVARRAALILSTTTLEANIIAKEAEIAVSKQSILTKEAEIVTTGDEIAAKDLSIATSRARIFTLEGEILVERELIVTNKAMTASLASTPWGAIAVAIGIVVGLIVALSNAEDDVVEKLKKIEDINSNNLKISNKKTQEALDERLKKEEKANRKKLVDHEITQEQFKNLTDEFTKKELIDLQKVYDDKAVLAKQNSEKLKKELENILLFNKKTAEQLSSYGSRGVGSNVFKDDLLTKEKILAQQQIADNAEKQSKTLADRLSKIKKEQEDVELQSEDEFDKKLQEKKEKNLKKAFDLQKKDDDDSYKLSQARLQSAIELEDEITQNEKLNLQERLDASSESDQLSLAKRQETLEYDLKNRGVYNEKTGQFERELTDAQIAEIVRGGDIVSKLNNEQLLTYETYQNDITKINKKGVQERADLSDNDAKKEADKLNKEFDDKLNQLKGIEDETNKIYESQLIELNKRLAKGAINKTEYDDELRKLKLKTANELFNTQTEYFKDVLLATIDFQIKEVELSDKSDAEKLVLLKALNDKKIVLNDEFNKIVSEHNKSNADSEIEDAKKYAKQREDSIKESSKIIAESLGIDASNLENFFENITANFQKLLEGGKLTAEDFKESFRATMEVVRDIGNSVFENRIANIEFEINKSNEFYDKQISLASNDSRKKDALEKEKAKKTEELEKKKAQQQHKQAVFNKALSIAQASVNMGQAITAALTAGPGVGIALAIVTAAIAGVALAAAIATPIPKYRIGRTGGKRERAIINEEVQEVVTGKGGVNPRIYEGKNALVDLMEGDMVHTSVDAYKKYMRSSSLQKVTIDNRRMDTYQASMVQSKSLDKEILDEMRMSRKAFEKNKPNINFSSQKVDINHELWKMQILNWKN